MYQDYKLFTMFMMDLEENIKILNITITKTELCFFLRLSFPTLGEVGNFL